MYNRKDKDVRIAETIGFIQFYHPAPDDTQDLVAALKSWQDDQIRANERKQISEAMHQGPFGNAEHKQLRRATILLRTAVLRHDCSKVQREVNGTGDAD